MYGNINFICLVSESDEAFLTIDLGEPHYVTGTSIYWQGLNDLFEAGELDCKCIMGLPSLFFPHTLKRSIFTQNVFNRNGYPFQSFRFKTGYRAPSPEGRYSVTPVRWVAACSRGCHSTRRRCARPYNFTTTLRQLASCGMITCSVLDTTQVSVIRLRKEYVC